MSYRSHADLGGQEGHGRVIPEPEGELFHHAWERQALALMLAMGATGTWNIDKSRSARETLPDYDSLSYYQVWIEGLEKLVTEYDLVGRDELAAGQMLHPPREVKRVMRAAEVAAALAKGSPTEREAPTPARFALGQRVRTRATAANHHTRLPAYARGKVGVIDQVLGAHVFADANAQLLGEQPRWLYTVVFDGCDLWGAASQNLTVSIDAWEPYLEPVA